MIDKPPFRRRITVRLITFFGLLALIGTFLGAFASIQFAKREFFHVMERQFNSTFRLAENSLDIIGQMARTWALHLAAQPELPQLRELSQEDATRQIERMRQEVHCDTLVVLDRRGHILYHSAFPERRGESLMVWQIVRQTINTGEPSYGIIEESGNFIIYGSGVRGAEGSSEQAQVVLAGFRISDGLVARLSQDTGIDMTFVRRTAVMASSFNSESRKLIDSPIPYLDYQTLFNNPRLSKEVSITGRAYYASVRQLRLLDPSMDGSLLLTYPRHALQEIVDRLRRQYLWSYAAGMLLFSLAIWHFSTRTMKPLRQLAERGRRVAQGDLTSTVIETRDEIGGIAASFNDLIGELATSKQQLERYAEGLERLVEQRTQQLLLANEELTRQATQDALTGLPNRKLFMDRLRQALLLAYRAHSGMALMFLDLDRFKWVNDSFGHQVGDELLQETARRIQGCLREGDTVARLGGDEFTVILSQSGTLADIEDVAGRLLQELATPFDLSDAPGTRIGGSIGIAVYPEHGETAEELLLHADAAMYEAKGAGRALYRFWRPTEMGSDSI